MCSEGIKQLDKDRIMRLVSPRSLDAFTSQVKNTSHQRSDSIYLRYILCSKDKELFSADIEESIIEDINYDTPLKEIVSIVCKGANLTADEVIELYSSEGYPLHNDELTNTGE